MISSSNLPIAATYVPADRFDAEPPDERGSLSLKTLTGILRRRRIVFLAPLAACVAGATALAVLLPSQYRSEALITAEPGLARAGDAPTLGPDAEAERQLGRMTEIVHRRTVLAKIAHDFSLVPGSGPIGEEKLTALRKRVVPRIEGPNTFSLGFDDSSPERAQQVTAKLVSMLISVSHSEREQRERATTGFLQQQLDQLSDRITGEEQQIEQYKHSAYDALPDQVPEILGDLHDTEKSLQENGATEAELRSRRASLVQQLQTLQSQGYTDDPAQAKADGLRLKLDQLRRRYTDQFPEVREVQAELASVEQAIKDHRAASFDSPDASQGSLRHMQVSSELQEVDSRLAQLRARDRSLKDDSDSLRQRLAAVPRHEMDLAGLTRKYEADKTQYESLRGELHDAQLTEKLEEANQGSFQVVEAPQIPIEPSGPHRMRIALLGLLAGLGLGIGAAFFAEQSDSSFQTVEQLEMPTRMSVLASIPSLPVHGGRLALPAHASQPLSLLDDPFGPAAEQYRILATKLINRRAARMTADDTTTLLVTSTRAGEGKTTATINLALALSRMLRDQPVLVLDADLGRASVHRMLDVPSAPGFADLLANPGDDPAAYIHSQHGIHVMPAGTFSPESRTSLSSPLARRVIARLRGRYPFVLIDAPPILAVAEGLILQEVVDSVLFVVRARMTPRELVWRSLASLDPARLAGIVMTDVDGIAEAYGYPYFDPSRAAANAYGAQKSW